MIAIVRVENTHTDNGSDSQHRKHTHTDNDSKSQSRKHTQIMVAIVRVKDTQR